MPALVPDAPKLTLSICPGPPRGHAVPVMKIPRLPAFALAAGLALSATALILAAGAPVPAAKPADATKQLDALVTRVKAKLKEADAAKRTLTEADLAAELKDFDALLAEHQGEQTDAVAEIAVMKAMLYVQVFEDMEKAAPLFRQIAKDFPRIAVAKEAGLMADELEKRAAADRMFKPGMPFPPFAAGLKDTAGEPFTLERVKGKVVLLDFWATWCGPCIDELPNVIAAYDKHHAAGFEILGISLDKAGDGEKLAAFTKERKMPWPQFFDGQFWDNQLVKQYGITAIPATFLLDGEGKILGKNLRGAALEKAVAEALKK
jgi:thiol-disulfide isomerase/thioredoxin